MLLEETEIGAKELRISEMALDSGTLNPLEWDSTLQLLNRGLEGFGVLPER